MRNVVLASGQNQDATYYQSDILGTATVAHEIDLAHIKYKQRIRNPFSTQNINKQQGKI